MHFCKNTYMNYSKIANRARCRVQQDIGIRVMHLESLGKRACPRAQHIVWSKSHKFRSALRQNSTEQSGYAVEATSMHACIPTVECAVQATFKLIKFKDVICRLTSEWPSHSDPVQARNMSPASSPYCCRANLVHLSCEPKV